MTPPYLVSPTAANHIDAIWSYIALDNLEAANRVEETIYEAFALLGSNPMLGATRRALAPKELRFWPVSRYPNYIVVYVPEPKPIQIVAVIHGKRDLRNLI
jgi:plasmid stabilization system protein ParE